jgi:hypothetical protein
VSQNTPETNPFTPSSFTENSNPIQVDDGSLTAVDWALCILCSGIGCIVGIVRMIQGKANGAKMVGISIGFSILWSIIRVAINAAMNAQ